MVSKHLMLDWYLAHSARRAEKPTHMIRDWVIAHTPREHCAREENEAEIAYMQKWTEVKPTRLSPGDHRRTVADGERISRYPFTPTYPENKL